MTSFRSALFVLASSLSLAACGGQTAPTTGGSISLVGTWDIQGSFTGDPSRKASTGILTLAKDEMLLVFGDDSLSFSAKADALTLIHTRRGVASPVTVSRVAQPFDTGIVPLSLGGAWTFADKGTPRCNAQIGGTTTVKCDQAARVSPLPTLNVPTTATRVSTLASSFGELGGEWKITSEKGASCSLRFEGAVVSIDCKGPDPRYVGTSTITFGDGVASGSTSTGFEFAAKRR